MSDGTLILLAGALLALGIGATLVASRLRVPGLVLFLGLGMLVGPDGLGLLELDNVELARTIGVIALALILFEGGLAAGWQEIRPVLWPSVSLAAIGTVGTAAVVGLAASELLGLGTTEALLLGAIVAPTDGAAVFSVLRGSSLDRRLARVLEGESGFNDAVAIVLVLGMIDLIEEPGFDPGDVVLLAARQLAVGALVGMAAGRLGALASSRINFASTGLYPVASVATAALSFGVASELGGSGFLSVYLTGLALGGAPIPRRTVADFHDGLAWVSQIAVFFTLGLLVVPSGFGAIAGDALLVAAVLMLVARPLATLLATIGSGLSLREQALLGWAGLRGAVPIVLATFAVIEGVPDAERFFDIVFFVVLASTVVQGVTLEPLARRLRVTGPTPALNRPLLEVGTIRRLGAEVVEFPVRAGDAIVGRLVNELGLPREALVSVIVRGEEALLPRGSTEIAAGDRLHILVRQRLRAAVEELFERWRHGPLVEPEAEAVPVFGRAAIFSVRPFGAEPGDAGAPDAVDGVPVRRVLRQRRGEPGALVQLDDGRYAVTGEGLVAVGAPRRLFRYCRDRIGRAQDEQARAWWQEVAGVLAARVVR
ncbi:MAG: potassium/proton antiporter [Nocardioidaceae bacterium]